MIKKYAAYFTWPVLIVSLYLLAGWLLGIDIIKKSTTQPIMMNPTTAVCLLLSVVAFYAGSIYQAKGKYRILSWGCSGFIILVGLLKIVSLSGLETHIDFLFFGNQVHKDIALGVSVLIAPLAALLLVFAGICLFLLSANYWLRLVNLLALVSFALSAFSFCCFLFGVPEYNATLMQYGMAVQSSTMFGLLALGILTQNADTGFMRVFSNNTTGGRMARAIMPTVIVIPIVFAYIRLYIDKVFGISNEMGVVILVTSTIVTLIGIVWFIARRLTEIDLARQQAEDYYHKMVDEVQDYAIILLDKNGNVVNWNRGAEKIKGFTAAEIIGKSVKQFYTSEDITASLPDLLLRTAIEKGRSEHEGWRQHKNGKLFWANVILTALYGDDGKLIGFSKVTRDLSEKKELEETLKRQAELYRMMPDAVMYGTQNLTLLGMNASAERMLGITEKELAGKRIEDYLKVDVLDGSREALRNDVWNGAGFWRGEILFTTPQGKRIYVLASLKAILSADGNPGWLGVYTDITQLKSLQERFSYAIESMQAGLWEWNLVDESKNWWSARHYEMLGYNPNEIEPSVKNFLDMIHPADVKTIARFAKRVNDRVPFETEARYRTKNGTYKWMAVVGQSKFDATDKPVSVIGSIVDIDDKKRAQMLVQQQADLISLLPDGIIICDIEARVLDMNAGAEKTFGIKREDAINKSVTRLAELDFVGSDLKLVQKDLREKGIVRCEVNIRNASGRETLALVTGKVMESQYDNITRVACVYTDISMLRLNEELKQALLQQQENNRYLEQLAYIGAHDLKAPIITIMGLIDLMNKQDLNIDEVREIAAMVKQSANQMHRTNSALNDVLRLKTNLSTIDIDNPGELITINQLLEDIRQMVETRLNQVSGTLQVSYGTLGSIRLPHIHFRSVLTNLVDNAIKYRDPKRNPEIKIDIVQTTEKLLITVSDNGLGMDIEKNRHKIFTIFKRMHNHVEGTGIGLYIIKAIVDAYGGNVSVKSQVGVGTVFTIELLNDNIAAWG